MTAAARPARPPRSSRISVLNVPHPATAARVIPSSSDPRSAGGAAVVEIAYDAEADRITPERLARARATVRFRDAGASRLTSRERATLCRGQRAIRHALFDEDGEGGGEGGEGEEEGGTADRPSFSLEGLKEEAGGEEGPKEAEAKGEEAAKEEEEEANGGRRAAPPPQDDAAPRRSLGTVKAQFMTAKLRSRLCRKDDGVLGVQGRKGRYNSVFGDKFGMYAVQQSFRARKPLEAAAEEDGGDERGDGAADGGAARGGGGEEEEEGAAAAVVDLEDVSYVRKPNLARILEEYEALRDHPKYCLKQVVLSRRFYLYAHRFANAQFRRCLIYPTLPQPRELDPWLTGRCGDGGNGGNDGVGSNGDVRGPPRVEPRVDCDASRITEKHRIDPSGHRFVIVADHQFGILMDGFPMEFPNWSMEIDVSRRCVAQINAMRGAERPRFVCAVGDLVDTESSFSGAIASWKKVMTGWERSLVFEQQVNDFKRVWAGLDPDIALVCLCGNHDVGNRATRASIKHWTDSFGDEYLSFWTNGTFNLCLNNCLFSNPDGAPDLYDEQLAWMEGQLRYARENDATHVFVHAHYPWFLKHEEEADDFLTSYSRPPPGWGPPGSSFADSYFTVPYEHRRVAMDLFRKYDVTACFCGHFHQNVVSQTSWGMAMIVTGPLSMNLESDIGKELANGEPNGIGMRVVDVGERGEFAHKWTFLDGEVEIYKDTLRRMSRMSLRDGCDEAARRSIRHLQKLIDDKEGEQGEDHELDFDKLMEASAASFDVTDSQAMLAVTEIDFDEDDF